MLIPKQNGYPDYFETTDEYDIHNFCNSDPEMVLLGIIHTHPGFDAFLSSVDLHMLHRYTVEELFPSIFLDQDWSFDLKPMSERCAEAPQTQWEWFVQVCKTRAIYQQWTYKS